MEEPWLRGSIAGVSTFVAPLLMSFQMAREDLARHTTGIGEEQLWASPLGLPSLGFQLRHIAGSVDRLGTYMEGRQLSDAQLAALRAEQEPGQGLPELLAAIHHAFSRCEEVAVSFREDQLANARGVGRKQLPTTVMGLIVHIAEHTQRHVGQAITTANVLKAMRAGGGVPR